MSRNVHKLGHRLFAGLLSLICLVSVISQVLPTAYADDPGNFIRLYFKDSEGAVITEDGAHADYTVSGKTQIVEIELRIEVNYAINAGDLTIKIPMYAFQKRDGSGGFPANVDALRLLVSRMRENWDILNEHENVNQYITDGYIEVSNKAFTSYQGTMSLRYDVEAATVEDKAPQSFDIEVEDKTGTFTTPDEITSSFDTHVDYSFLNKEASGNYADYGGYYEWHDSLEKRFKLLDRGIFADEDDFNAQCADNYFVCYLIQPSSMSTMTNQPCTIYIDEDPEHGEVIAVSRMTSTQMSPGEPLEKVAAPVIPGADFTFERDVWKDHWNAKDGNPIAFFVLVKYPKEPRDAYGTDEDGNVQFTNRAALALVGDDHPEAPDTVYKTREMKSIWQTAQAVSIGSIWGIEKSGYPDPLGALTSLRNGRDVPFSYDITGIGKTYKYVDDKKYDVPNTDEYVGWGGPYRLEVIDDAMYVNGLGEDGLTTSRLLPEDFHFKTFTLAVTHNVVNEVDLKWEIRDSYPKPFDEREQVEVWVMTEANGEEWVLDQTVENIAYVNEYGRVSDTVYADEENNTVFSFNRADEGIYRVRFVYNNANGDVKLKSTVTGDLRAQGSTVQRVLANLEANDIANFQLFNWDAEMGYDAKDRWRDPWGAETIKGPDDMIADLLELDTELYSKYSHGPDRYSQRRVAQNNLQEVVLHNGAAKQVYKNVWDADGILDLEYYIAAVESAGAPNTANLEELLEMGAIEPPKEIVFHELLPIGVEFVGVEAVTLRNSSDGTNWVDFSKGQYNWDSSFAAQSQGGIQSQVDVENAPEIEWEIEDVYFGDGKRQMVTITVRYDDGVLPIVRLGLMGSVYGLGTVLRVKCMARPYDLVETVRNNFAAHFVDSEGSTIILEGGTVYPDDGSIFGGITDVDDNNVFEDVDGDGDTDSTTVVGAEFSYTENARYSDTQLVKWIKEDKLDTYFKKYTQTYAGHDYTYKIQFYTNEGTVRNVVIFDSIEEAFGYNAEDLAEHPQKYEDERHWKGTLRGIDLTEAEYAGFDSIKVYVNKEKFYSDAEMATNVYEGYEGLTPQALIAGRDGWEAVEPEEYETYDWENVKTIAFRIGEDQYFGKDYVDPEGVLHEDLPSKVSVYLKMTAPDTVPEEQTADEQVLAYNNPGYYSEKLSAGTSWIKQTTVANTVTIGMKSAEADMPAVSKTYTGDELYEDFEETCVFEIRPIDGAPAPRAYVDGQWGGVVSELGIVLSADNPSVTARSTGRLLFTEPGVYEYEISEKASDGAGVTYSGAKYRVVFNVTDEREIDGETPQYAENTELQIDMEIYLTHDENGTELEEPIKVSSIDFENDYSYGSTQIELPVVEKTVEGDVPEGTDKTFTFEIRSAEGENNPMPENTTATVTGSGEATAFGTVIYTAPGVYSYEIFEQELDESYVGYTKDETVYTLTVTVKDIGGALEAEYVITKEQETVDKLSFVNTYAPKPAEAALEVEKKVDGAAPETAETYIFELIGKDGAPVPENNKATVTGAGKASFDSWRYTEAGVYVYEVREVAGESENCTYDASVYTVTDTVTDKDGVLELSRVITKGDEEVETVEFVNSYTETDTGDDGSDGSDGGDNSQTGSENSVFPLILLIAAAAAVPAARLRVKQSDEE